MYVKTNANIHIYVQMITLEQEKYSFPIVILASLIDTMGILIIESHFDIIQPKV